MEKGKNNFVIKLLKVVLTIFIIYIEILTIIFFYKATYTISIYTTVLFELIKAILVLHIIYKQQVPEYKLVWVTIIMFFPIPGLLLYIFWGNKSLSKDIKQKLEKMDTSYGKKLVYSKKIYKQLKDIANDKYRYANYVYNTTSYPLYKPKELKYFNSGEKYLKSMIEDFKNAKESIFLEYFIIGEGKIWQEIFSILKQKAKEGVKICIITDEIGSATSKPKRFKKILKENNIHFKIFNPVFPFNTSYINFRDHRKITVIDSKIAYTGGINIKDEYANIIERFGKWKDAGIRLTGAAVNSYTVMFIELWNYIDNSNRLFIKKYLNKDKTENEGFILPYVDGPGNDSDTAKFTYLNIINNAKKYVYIMTPYLIIDEETTNSLILAAKSGIDIKIIVPYIHDKKTVKILMPTFYKTLIKEGIEIYRYKPGFVHSKVCLCDDEIATVGTVNFDYRSFYLHFECGLWLYKTGEENRIKEDFLDTFAVSEKVNLNDFRKRNVFIRILEAILKVLSPLL